MTERLPNERGLAASAAVVLLGAVAFTSCIAAEFEKVKAKDMVLDGSLCSLPISSAFGLGIAAIVCISVVKIVGTTMAFMICRQRRSDGKDSRRYKTLRITLLVLSWLCFGLAVILLAAGSSMNAGQPYGKGWLDGECYVVNSGVYVGGAVLTVVMVVSILGYVYSSTRTTMQWRTRPDIEEKAGEVNESDQMWGWRCVWMSYGFSFSQFRMKAPEHGYNRYRIGIWLLNQ